MQTSTSKSVLWRASIQNIRSYFGNETGAYLSFQLCSMIYRYAPLGILGLIPTLMYSDDGNPHGLSLFFVEPIDLRHTSVKTLWILSILIAWIWIFFFPLWFAFRSEERRRNGTDEYELEGRFGTGTRYDIDRIEMTSTSKNKSKHKRNSSVRVVEMDTLEMYLKENQRPLWMKLEKNEVVEEEENTAIEALSESLEQQRHPLLTHIRLYGRSHLLFGILLVANILINMSVNFFLSTKTNQTIISLLLSFIMIFFNMVWLTISIRTTLLEYHKSDISRSNSLFWKTFFFRVLTCQTILWLPMWFSGVSDVYNPEQVLESSALFSAVTIPDTLSAHAKQKLLQTIAFQRRCVILIGIDAISGLMGGLFMPMLIRKALACMAHSSNVVSRHQRNIRPCFSATTEYAKSMTRTFLAMQCWVMIPSIGIWLTVLGLLEAIVDRIKIVFMHDFDPTHNNTYLRELIWANIYIWIASLWLPQTGSVWIFVQFLGVA